VRELLTEDELQALLSGTGRDDSDVPVSLEGDDRKLLHALVRNQLRLLHMIEELQSEIRHMTASAGATGETRWEIAAGLEPLPLPFLKKKGTPGSFDDEDETQEAPSAEASRKERFKRKSFW